MESSRVVNRRSVNKNSLNQQQKIAHDLIANALKLNTGKSTSDGGNDVSRLQLLLGKGGLGKSHVLDAVIATLKENDNYADES